MDRHYLYIFSERRAYCIFSTFLRSNQRYHRLYKFHWKDKRGKPGEHFFSFSGRHKSFYKYTTKRGYWSVSAEHMKICTKKPNYKPARNAYINPQRKFFPFQWKALPTTHVTAMSTKTAVSLANIFMLYVETQSLSKTVFKPTVWKRYMDDIFSVWDIKRSFLRTSKFTLPYY